MKKRKNSRQKGARGERAAAAYLQSLGFAAARMGRNGYSAEDLDCRECPVLSRVHLEVKRDESFTLHGQGLADAVEQAMESATRLVGPSQYLEEVTKPYAVLWRRNRTPWCLTYHGTAPPLLVTTTGDERIREALKWLANSGDGR